MFTYIDLFAGCGGLSLGLESEGFKSVLAVEKSDMAAETYYRNFIQHSLSSPEFDDAWEEFKNLPFSMQSSHGLVVGEVALLLSDKQKLSSLKEQNIDVIAGGPPCQGFSLAGRRNPEDPRNQLPWQFIDIIDAISPKIVVMENVLGMSQNFKKHNIESPFDLLKAILEKAGQGYVVQQVLLNAMHYGVPQHRPRVMLIGFRSDLAKVLDISSSNTIWKSNFSDCIENSVIPVLAPKGLIAKKDCLTAEDALWDISNDGYLYDATSDKYKKKKGKYAFSMRTCPSKFDSEALTDLQNHHLRKHSQKVIDRFAIYQFFSEQGLPTSILQLPNNYSGSELISELDNILKSIKYPVKTLNGTLIASSREDLYDKFVMLKTKKHSQRSLAPNKPAPTVVSLPDDFIHYKYPRTLTVRELARIQSFPDSFIFKAKETTGGLRRRVDVPQYTQVGNAVPPILAKAVGKTLSTLLREI